MSDRIAIAYCGPAATPADLLKRWDLDPLLIADQQLAGLLMWAPASLPYVGVGLWLARSNLRLHESTA